jgi:poly-gamma-glutamate capsule biosynthesis protein CapA/YwtB (metallophosphatase superfamily)
MSSIRLIAVGDTALSLPPGVSHSVNTHIFENCFEMLRKGDLRFAQIESVFSNRGTLDEVFGYHSVRADPSLVKEYVDADFDVVSLASNHTMDWGSVGALDTIEAFKNNKIATVGSGPNIAEARKPVVFERNGVTISILGYCSVLAPASWATQNRAGSNPLRARTYYEPYDFHPATPARIRSVVEEEDLEQMKVDIYNAKSKSDVVMVSAHWGVHHVPGYVSDYEIQAAHAAIDAGCDVVFGHHPHLLKGVQIYKGKPIIYSMGNFAMLGGQTPRDELNMISPTGKRSRMGDAYDADFGPKIKYKQKQYFGLSTVAEINLSKEGTVDTQFLPIYLESGRPMPVRQGDPKFEEIVEFLQWSSERFGTKWELNGDKLILRN